MRAVLRLRPVTTRCFSHCASLRKDFNTTSATTTTITNDAPTTTTTVEPALVESAPEGAVVGGKPSPTDKINKWLYKTKGAAQGTKEDLTLGPEWKGYEKATDGRGLRVVGIRELTEDAEEWVVQRFFPEALNVKKASKAVVYTKVRRAVVEEYAQHLFPELNPLESVRSTITHAELPVETVEADTEAALAEASGEAEASQVPVYEEAAKAARLVGEQHDYTTEVSLEKKGSNELLAEFKSEDVVRNVLAGRQEVPTEYVDLSDERGVKGEIDFQASWLDAPFANEELKFKIFKRIFQLTGIPIPQRDLNIINTPGQAIESLLTPPKAAKLAERLLEAEDAPLVSLPNVKVLNTRLTKVLREKEIGRDHHSQSRILSRIEKFKKKGEEGKDELAKLEYVYPYIEKRLPGGDAVRVHTQGGNKWDGKMQIEGKY